jgi:predicted dehydrogenase
MCLLAGKHVLCEKAFTINAQQAKELVDLARRQQCFLMEAMWTRFFPIHVHIREMLQQGTIGEVNGLIVNFVAKAPFDPKNRFFDLNQGAGVLLDTGSYGISWAYSLLGKPDEVTGLAYFGETGADYRSAYILKYDRGPLVTITCCQTSYDVKEAVIYGSKGKIVVQDPWYKPTLMALYSEGSDSVTVDYPLGEYNGYEYEACAVMDSILQGKLECDVMPLDETISIMETMDALRSSWGFKYPFEEKSTT